MTTPCTQLDWDSRFFGFPIAQVTTARAGKRSLDAVERWSHDHGVRCLYWLIPAKADGAMRLAHEMGYRFVGSRVELSCDTAGTRPPGTTPRGVRIRAAQPSDARSLRTIASRSHRASRFYADGGFPRRRCDHLYETWIQRSLDSTAETVALATVDGVGAGYIAYGPATGHGGVIGLLGVDDRYRGRGIAGVLIARALDWAARTGLPRVSVVTQGGNVAAMRAYQRRGFEVVSVDQWFHKWFPTAGQRFSKEG